MHTTTHTHCHAHSTFSHLHIAAPHTDMQSEQMDVNKIIVEACDGLRLSRRTRTVTQIIYNQAWFKIRRLVSPVKLAYSSLFLACKAVGLNISGEEYTAATGRQIDSGLESEIMEILEYNLDYFDVYQYALDVCGAVGISEEYVVERLDRLYSDERLNRVGFFRDGEYEPPKAALAAFRPEDLDLIANVYCFAVDRDEMERIRGALYAESA